MGCQSMYEGQSRTIRESYSSYKVEPTKSRTPRVSKPKAKRPRKTFGKSKR